ncbi:Cyclic di-GMP phosphodiesterase PdeB [Andreprevotia sp. IGB-42]|uniref:EAL domain-containing protein n=1 Tax=Andreprevotia sp. IGB-42 TaxID=2497473 RepID=UPI001359A717|nr:EAL domain-containing protein [Andreprevotia sp. IGB-42]KAF0814548.1 Cyclic di-GMP phosphodiesterase PdeB [Andreprevotia sp. IGB-42]
MRFRIPSFLFPVTLRGRLILFGGVLQLLLIGLLAFNTIRLWQDTARHTMTVRVQEVSRLFAAALTGPMSSSDYARAGDLLDRLRTPEGIDYLVLQDARGQVITARSWDIAQPLPAVTDLEHGTLPDLINAEVRIEQGGQILGRLRYGMSMHEQHSGLARLLLQNTGVLLLWSALLVLLFAVLAFTLKRRLLALIGQVENSASKRFEVLPDISGEDEVARLSRRVVEMGRNIRTQIDVLVQNERKFHAIADHTPSAELWLNPEGRLVWVNATVNRLTGYSANACMLLGDFPLSLALPEERARLADTLTKALAERTEIQDFEFRAVRRDGSYFWASVDWMPIYDVDGQYQGLRLSLRDNTELKDDRLALRKAVIELRQIQSLGQSYLQRAESERARLTALLAAMRFGVLFVDNDNRVLFHNPAFSALWGVSGSAVLAGRPIGQVLQQAENRPAIGDIIGHYLEDHAFAEERVDFGELTMNDGRVITQQCYQVIDAQGAANGKMWLYEDVTQQRQIAERMINLAERDALTGLYNRHRFQQELERMVSEADRRDGTMALVFFDLDEFKYVNDTFGHGVGDELLKSIGREIGSQVRRHEVLSRLGGDEFAILVPDCNEFEVSKLAERIVGNISQLQFAVDGHVLKPSSSVGVALFPQHANNAAELVAHADSAMYQAKAAGKSTWRLYRAEADQSKHALSRLSWKDRIQEALENEGFELYFQGIYDARTRELEHLEALVRMKDPANPGSVIMPGHFIPAAEKTGKIIELDRWVIRRVIKLLAEKPYAPSIAVNVSGRSFDEPGMPDYIAGLLREYHVDPKRLLVELTETAAVSDLRDAQRFIDALRDTGCVVCLDDFGNGFASFAYLKQLKADVLKIDGFFIKDLPSDRDSQVFVRGMVGMAHDMGKTTIAEFVEDETILNMLVEIGIDLVQGYFLDRPMADHPGLRPPEEASL